LFSEAVSGASSQDAERNRAGSANLRGPRVDSRRAHDWHRKFSETIMVTDRAADDLGLV